MIQIEKKISMNESDGSVKALTGLYLIRIATKIPMPVEVARMAVINHLRGEIESRYPEHMVTGTGARAKKEALLADLEVLSRIPVVFHTKENYSGEYGDIEYHQIVLNLTEEEQNNASNRMSFLNKLSYNLCSALYNSYGDCWVHSTCPTTDFIYTLSDTRFSCKNHILMVKNDNADLNKFIELEYKPQNHIAISYETNVDKTYNKNSIVRIRCSIHPSLDEAFNNRNSNTVSIDQEDGYLGRFTFAKFATDYHRSCIRIKVMYKDKTKLIWYKNMAIFYDGEKSLESARPYFDCWNDRGIKQVDLLQFSSHKDFFYQEGIGQNFALHKLVLVFLNKDKMDLARSSISIRNNNFSGTVSYYPRKDHKRIYYEVGIGRNGIQYLGSAIIPVDKENIQDIALKDLDGMIRKILPPTTPQEEIDMVTFDTYGNEFKECLFGLGPSQPDTLSEWFKYCTRTSKQNDDNIVKAYEKMKVSLENEYKEIGAYLNHYDFSKCLPVPRVKTDNKMAENYYKSLHIEPKTVIINTINNKYINSIQEIQPTITFMFLSKDKRIYKSDYPIIKFYNNKTNEVELFYDILKGEVIRDKVKNRR